MIISNSSDTQLAHDLNKDVWRSDDIAFGANQAGHIEIITPDHQSLAKSSNSINESNNNSSANSFLLQNVNSTFSAIKINAQIVEDLKRCGFVRPSPIQSTAIPLGRIGIDLIAQSKSGTGKTIVFVVCALEMVIESLHQPASPRVLIVAPTREIAVQIGSIIDSLTSTWSNFACYKAIGGTKVSENISQLATSQIIVGTPGRICCLLEMDFLKPNSIRMLVLDECDKLMEESFMKQINKLFGFLPANKQMIVTSATMSDEMTLFLANYMRNPALVRLNADNPALIGVIQLYHRTEGHSLDYLNFEAKIDPLLTILRDISFSQCVVFSNFQTRAKYLFDRLVAAKWTVMHISGDMTQKERLEAINAFRKHKCRILVSTDLTSRGIDIDTVNLIINLDVPIDSETYLHRIGRAGRFGSAGIAITLVGSDIDSRKFKSIINEYKLEVEELTLPIKVNPWNKFYQDRLDRNRSLLEKSWKEGLQMNEQFCSIIDNYSKLHLHTPVDDNQVGSRVLLGSPCCTSQMIESNSNVHREKAFYPELFTPQALTTITRSESVLSDLPIEIASDQPEESQCNPSSDDESVCSDELDGLNCQKSSGESEVSEVEEKQNEEDYQHDFEWQVHHQPTVPLANVTTTHEENHCSTTRDLFKCAFLRPPTIAARDCGGHFPSLIHSNVAICKYLLKGGRSNVIANDCTNC